MERLSIQTDDPFIDLWKDFFNTIGIKERRKSSVSEESDALVVSETYDRISVIFSFIIVLPLNIS